MLLASLLALTVVVMPSEAPASPDDVRFVQDEFGDAPPPPPPPGLEEPDEAVPPPPPPSGGPSVEKSEKSEKKKRSKKAPSEEGADEPDFIEKYFPFALSDDLHPELEDSVWAFWLVQVLPVFVAPQAWVTPMIFDGEPPEDYVMDAIIIYVTHLAPHACLYAATLPCLIIPWVNICGGLCLLANGVACVANFAYLMPVAFANRMNDGYVPAGTDKKRGSEWLDEPRRDDALASAMAY